MSDVAELQIKIHSEQINTANKRLDDLEKKGGKAERATDGLTGSFTSMLGPLLTVTTAIAGFMKIVNTQREFDRLNAGLITATGSAENAAAAFEAIQQFATKTPYDLAQTTDAFTKLVNYGLNPSEHALTSYGNTASAMGRDLSQMVTAVADAVVGQYRPLKEFGVIAEDEGNKVKFTFRGTATEVAKNSKDIQNYLIQLGDAKFAGAMEERMKTLDGAISNLGDEFSKLLLGISKSGLGDMIAKGVRLATSALAELGAMFASGEISAYLTAIGHRFGWLWDVVVAGVKTIYSVWSFFYNWLHSDTNIVGRFLNTVFGDVLGWIKYGVQRLAIDFAISFEAIKAYAQALYDGVKAIFNDDTVAGVTARLNQRLTDLANTRTESLEEIDKERKAAIDRYDAEIAKAKELRAEYDKNQAAKNAQTGDRLARFDVGDQNPETRDDAGEKKRASEFKALKEFLMTEEEQIEYSYQQRKSIIEKSTKEGSEERTKLLARLYLEHQKEISEFKKKEGEELKTVRESLQTQEEEVKQSYENRVRLILANTKEMSALRADLLKRAQLERDQDLKEIVEHRAKERAQLFNNIVTEEDELRASYERRKADILESTVITETERQDLLLRLQKKFQQEQKDLQTQHTLDQLQSASEMFGGLADLAKEYGGEQSKAYRTLFAASKAFSLVQAFISMQTGISKALELGFPANIAEIAKTISIGTSAIASIRGSNYSGAYDKGGSIPAGKIGLVGEYGPEIVHGPASVTSRRDTAELLKGGPAQGPTPVYLRNVNVFDDGHIADYLGSDAGERIVMNHIRKNADQVRSLATGTGG